MPQQKRILIVEDDHDLCLELSDLLNEFGFSTAVADNGVHALATLEACSGHEDDPLPSVILLDLNMPEMDGWQLREKLKGSARYRAIPIIIMSGDSAAKEVDFTKPLDLHQLVYTLQHS